MTIIKLEDWRKTHARASDALAPAVRRPWIEARTLSLIPFTRRAPARATSSFQYSDGIFPRARQLLTTGIESFNPSATTAVPCTSAVAKASITSLGVVIGESTMTANLFTPCEYVKFHETPMARRLWSRHPLGMPERFAAIGNRLAELCRALDLSQAEFCRRIGVEPNRFNPYVKGKRKITLEVAERIKAEFGVSLDWIYDGERRTLTEDLRSKIPRAA